MFPVISLLLGFAASISAHAALDPERIPQAIRSDVESVLHASLGKKSRKNQAAVVAILHKLERFEADFLEKGTTPKNARELSVLFQSLAFLRAIDLDSGTLLGCDSVDRTLKAQMGDFSQPGEYEPAYSIVHELVETFCEPSERKSN